MEEQEIYADAHSKKVFNGLAEFQREFNIRRSEDFRFERDNSSTRRFYNELRALVGMSPHYESRRKQSILKIAQNLK